MSGSQKTVYEEARSQMTRINAAKAALEAAERACESSDDVEACKAADQLMDALAEFEVAGGYEAEKRIAGVLDGLGFARSQWEVRCDVLGGWQMRVALARLLLSPAGSGEKGLLLLDEPTNHLDEASKRWLANWIKSSPCTTIIVSHEQERRRRVLSHGGGSRPRPALVHGKLYQIFGGQRRAHRARQGDVREATRGGGGAEGFHPQVQRQREPTQAQSRQKLLDKLQKEMRLTVSAATVTTTDGAAGDASKMNLRAAKPPPSNVVQLRMKDAVLGYDASAPILKGSLELERDMRVIVLGPNGAGKSTLLKTISGVMPLIGGEREITDDRVKLGVFSQDLAQYLPKEKTCLEYVLDVAREEDPLMKEEQGRASLGALGITGTMALRKIGSLSGGEKARVALAAFVLQPRNCLLLDEPSNHLDVGAVRALTDGLQGWNGCLFAVSHNKAFCESLNPTHVRRVKNGEFRMENCYGLTDADFEHEEQTGDATAMAAAAAAIVAATEGIADEAMTPAR